MTGNPRATRRALLKVHKLAASATRRHIRLPLGPQAEYTVPDLSQVLLYACENGTAVTWSGPRLRDHGLDLPDGDTVLRQFGRADWKELAKGFTRLHREPLVKAWRSGLLQGPVNIAIDFTDEPWYGKDPPFIVRSEADRGTTRFIRFAHLSVVEPGRRLVVASVPVDRNSEKAEWVRMLLRGAQRQVRIRRVYMDRGFHSIPVVRLLNRMGLRFLMPARQTGTRWGWNCATSARPPEPSGVADAIDRRRKFGGFTGVGRVFREWEGLGDDPEGFPSRQGGPLAVGLKL